MKVKICEEYNPRLYIDEDDDGNAIEHENGVEIPDDIVRIIQAAQKADHAAHVLLCNYERRRGDEE